MLTPGSILQKRYRVIRELGHGGMGTVYEALDQRINCLVAIKQIITSSNEESRRAFEREASLLANLRHSALPKVMDYFTEEESDFLVMEFVPGHDLAQLMQQTHAPFPQVQVLHWARATLTVLEYLHSQNPPILHRDIKPSNLKLTSHGELFLLDFGLAKGAAGQMPTLATSRSVQGYTPVYAALEQILGKGTDHRSDLYSLGATLYHLLTGHPPMDAASRFSAIQDEQPDPLRPIRELNPNVTLETAIINHALALNRRHRPNSATEMREAIEQVLSQAEQIERDERTVVESVSAANSFPAPTKLATDASVESLKGATQKIQITTIRADPAMMPPDSELTIVSPQRKSGRHIIIGAGLLLTAILIGTIVWTIANRYSQFSVSLTPDDMALIAARESEEFRAQLASDQSARKTYAKDIRTMLALAEEARRKELDKKPNIQRQLEFRRATVLSEFYFAQHGQKAEDIPQKEIDEFFTNPINQQKFEQYLESEGLPKERDYPKEQLNLLKRSVGAVYVSERKAKEQGLDNQPAIKLQIMLQQAHLLALQYTADNLREEMKATDAEIDMYLSNHPELNADKQKAREATEREKYYRLLDEIVSRSHVSVPDEFRVSPPGK